MLPFPSTAMQIADTTTFRSCMHRNGTLILTNVLSKYSKSAKTNAFGFVWNLITEIMLVLKNFVR